MSLYGALQEPLLADGALTWRDPAPGGGSSGAVPVPGWGRPPLPPSAGPRTIAGRGGAHATMARCLLRRCSHRRRLEEC